MLICGAEPMTSYSADIQTKLLSTGRFSSVDIFNCYSGTPSLSLLRKYNAILVYSDGTFFDSTLMGNNLAAYIDSGGGVVCAMFDTYRPYVLAGAFKDSNYTVIVPDSATSYVTRSMGAVLLPSHPIMHLVHSFNGGHCSYETVSGTITGGSYRVANYDNGDLFIVAKETAGYTHNRRRADLNFFPPSSSVEICFWADSTDGTQIIANALLWVHDSTKDTVIVAPSFVDEAFGGKLVTVYPNPSNGKATLELTDPQSEITITDALGRQTSKLYPIEKATAIEFLHDGIYFIKIVSPAFTKTIKILVVR